MKVSITENAGGLDHRPSRRSGYRPVYKTRTIGHAATASVVATRQLSPVIERIVEEMERELKFNDNSGNASGVSDALCARASAISGRGIDGLYRRLYDIRHDRTRAVKAESAEVFLMAAGYSMRDLDVLELPAGLPAAKERIEVWLELRGGEMSKRQITDLAEDLLEFTRLMVHGVEQGADVVELPQVEEQLALVEAA